MRRLALCVACVASTACGEEFPGPSPVSGDDSGTTGADANDSGQASDASDATPDHASATDSGDAGPSFWVMGYYAGWTEGTLPVASIGFDLLTEVIHFDILPNADGTIDATQNGMSDAQSQQLVSAAHKAGKRALVCLGGADSQSRFQPAIAQATRAAFVANVVDWTAKHGYDGVDLDMEPIDAGDVADFVAFVKALRTAIDARIPNALLTAAVAWQPAAFAQLAGTLDRIDVMTYDMSGPYPGWETWYNSPLGNGGKHFQSNPSEPLPAIDIVMPTWTGAGIPSARLGVGVPFYGTVWNGATGPNQSIGGVTVAARNYSEIMSTLFNQSAYHWDSAASVPWLGLNSQFVSYDDEQSAAAKVTWAKSHGFGGTIVWELAGDWVGGKHPLLESIANAAK